MECRTHLSQADEHAFTRRIDEGQTTKIHVQGGSRGSQEPEVLCARTFEPSIQPQRDPLPVVNYGEHQHNLLNATSLPDRGVDSD
jgi:hypothetical protein